MNRFSKGFLLVLEGLDGAGKTTVSNLIASISQQEQWPVVQTKEPGDSCIGSTIRTIVTTTKAQLEPLAEYLLFAADRAQHVKEVITPALQKGALVISDRMTDSSLAYQGYGRGLSCEKIALVNAWALEDIRPNLTVYIQIPVETAMLRIHNRQEEKHRFEEQASFLERAKIGFDEIFKTPSPTRLILDGKERPELLAQKIYQQIQHLKEQ